MGAPAPAQNRLDNAPHPLSGPRPYDSCPYGCIYNAHPTLTGWYCHGPYIDLYFRWNFGVSDSVNVWEKSPGSGGIQNGPYFESAPSGYLDVSYPYWVQGHQYTSEVWDSTGHSSGWQTVYSSGCPA